MRKLLFIFSIFLPTVFYAQSKSAEEFQLELNKQYTDSIHSPLKPEDRKNFTELPFYPIDSTFIIPAKFVRLEKEKSFKMKTTTDRKPEYKKFGLLHFIYQGKEYTLSLYQNLALIQKEEYRDYLFLPFTDETNGDSTYGGGRFLDFTIPESDTVLIDFNKSYNPYCAYNYKYSCPIPPKENHLGFKVKAGVKYVSHD